jgi:hypothetical protein
MKLINYTNTNIQGNCTIDDGFVPVMDHINDVCKKHNFVCIVTSSKRNSTLVKGAIVTPAQMSNHLVGHAIDCNLKNLATGEYFNSEKMKDGKGEDEAVIAEIESTMIRWGGRFKATDSVHFDSGLNLKNPAHWHILNTAFNG